MPSAQAWKAAASPFSLEFFSGTLYYQIQSAVGSVQLLKPLGVIRKVAFEPVKLLLAVLVV